MSLESDMLGLANGQENGVFRWDRGGSLEYQYPSYRSKYSKHRGIDDRVKA